MRRLVVFEVDALALAIPLEAVDRALRMVAISPLPGSPPVVRGVIDLGGRLLPVADPRVRLGLAPRRERPEDRLLVVRTPRRTLALAVDEVRGLREVDDQAITPVDSVLPSGGPIQGIARLPDGLVLIQDMEEFLSLEEETALQRAMAGVEGTE